MLNTVKATPILYPHIPDEPDDKAIADLLRCMTWGVCYRLSDRVSLEIETPDMQAEMGLCWIDPDCPGAAIVYIDGKPFAFQNVEWVQKQCEQTHVNKWLERAHGTSSGRLCTGDS
jgi:hypothetical protein